MTLEELEQRYQDAIVAWTNLFDYPSSVDQDHIQIDRDFWCSQPPEDLLSETEIKRKIYKKLIGHKPEFQDIYHALLKARLVARMLIIARNEGMDAAMLWRLSGENPL